MIDISQRLRPFSLIAGSQCLIPGTRQSVKAFPDRIEIGEEKIALPGEPLSLYFSLQQDLERNCVWVFGNLFKVQIKASIDGIHVMLPTGPYKIFGDFGYREEFQVERLFLGVTKAQDWDLMQRRADLKELLPVLYFLAQKTPPIKDANSSDILNTLQDSMKLLTEKKRLNVNLEKLILCLYDNCIHAAMPKVNILPQLFTFIRAMFVQENLNKIAIFPRNPFSRGRLMNVNLDSAFLDLQWSNSQLRQMIIRPKKDGQVAFSFPYPVKSFRVKLQENDKGVTVDANSALIIENGKKLLLDRFYI